MPPHLANGVHLVARSFKYHRPRGIFCSGTDEPNALVQLARGARTEPNVRATTQELFEGLVAASQNRWPSLGFDVGAINDALSRLLPAGFYYKTFMWPPTPRWWLRYEHFIRRAAGMGRSSTAPDPDRYEHQYAHCDVRYRGAARRGDRGRVPSGDENAMGRRPRMPTRGSTTGGRRLIAAGWVAPPECGGAPRTTAFGYYDGNLVGTVEQSPIISRAAAALPRQRCGRCARWLPRGLERGIATGNDVPGTMPRRPRM